MHVTSLEATGPAGDPHSLATGHSAKELGAGEHTAWIHARLPRVHVPRAISQGEDESCGVVEAMPHLGRVAQLAQVSRGFFRSRRLKITQAFVTKLLDHSNGTDFREAEHARGSCSLRPALWANDFSRNVSVTKLLL